MLNINWTWFPCNISPMQIPPPKQGTNNCVKQCTSLQANPVGGIPLKVVHSISPSLSVRHQLSMVSLSHFTHADFPPKQCTNNCCKTMQLYKQTPLMGFHPKWVSILTQSCSVWVLDINWAWFPCNISPTQNFPQNNAQMAVAKQCNFCKQTPLMGLNSKWVSILTEPHSPSLLNIDWAWFPCNISPMQIFPQNNAQITVAKQCNFASKPPVDGIPPKVSVDSHWT